MKPESGKTKSLWAETSDVPQFSPLNYDIYTEVCIIGGGIAGLTTAYLCAKAGMSVVVLDDNDICGGETHRTTAHLSNELDDRYSSAIKMLGEQKAKLALRSHTEAINMIENIVADEGISCQFERVPGYLFCAPGQSRNELQKELEACQKLGFRGVELLQSTPFGFKSNRIPCIKFPRQAQFHVLRYLTGVAQAITRMGGKIFTYTHAAEVKDGKPAQVITATGAKVRASWVVCATNSPVTDYMQVWLKEAAWRTYAAAARVPVGYVDRALFWDLDDPYHYIRTQPLKNSDEEWLIVGGEDHRTGQEEDPASRFTNLDQYIRSMFPAVENIQLHWSGQVVEPLDGLALIGKDPERGDNILIYTGDSGMGMTHGTIAGIVLTDIMQKQYNPWTQIYDPARWPLKAPLEWVCENFATARGYMKYITGDTVESLTDIPAGQGGILDHNGKRIAAYKDEHGEVTQLSAVCPHMKALLQWNACEQSWDCPAHGSRFTATGEVIDGPANSNMNRIPPEAQVCESFDEDQAATNRRLLESDQPDASAR